MPLHHPVPLGTAGERYFVQEDLLSHEIFAPKTFCLMNQLFGLGATNCFGLGAPSFLDHKVPQSLWKVPFDLEAPSGST